MKRKTFGRVEAGASRPLWWLTSPSVEEEEEVEDFATAEDELNDAELDDDEGFGLLLSSAAFAEDANALAASSPWCTFPTTRSMLLDETVLLPTAAPPRAAQASRASRQKSFASLPLLLLPPLPLLPLPLLIKPPAPPPPLLTGDQPPGDRRGGPREPGGLGAPVGSIDVE